jgi:hypothetical protein
MPIINVKSAGFARQSIPSLGGEKYGLIAVVDTG